MSESSSKSEGRLSRWAAANAPGDEMRYRDRFWQQIMFVRDRVAGLMASTYAQCCDLVDVVSTHRSKSVLLPVYLIDLPAASRAGGEAGGDLRVWMRGNFHDWNVSVDSPDRPVEAHFLGCFDDRSHHYCFCQGMPQETVFGTYAENQRAFTVCVADDYDLYVFFRALKEFFGIVPTD